MDRLEALKPESVAASYQEKVWALKRELAWQKERRTADLQVTLNYLRENRALKAALEGLLHRDGHTVQCDDASARAMPGEEWPCLKTCADARAALAGAAASHASAGAGTMAPGHLPEHAVLREQQTPKTDTDNVQ